MRKIHLFLMFVAAVTVAADNPETLAERSQSRGRAVLDKAVDAIGGEEALRAINSVQLELQGPTWNRLQMTTPEAPFEAGTLWEKVVFDLENNRLRREQKTTGAGFEGNNTIILKGGEGSNYDYRAKTITPVPTAQVTQQQFVQYYRRIPNLLLRQALDNPNTVRYLGEDPFEGRKQDVITFVMPDTQQVAVYVDAKTGLVSKYELVLTDPLAGEDVSEIIYSDYTTSGKLKVPQKWTWKIAGELQADYKIAVQFNPSISDDTFEIADSGFTKVDAPPTPAPNVEKLADGVFVIQNVAGNNQNTMAVEFKDYILAVEAPGTSAGADNIIRKIKEAIPNKPIRYVAMTHHHGDHMGGLRSFIAEGATVVTTPGNRKIVEAMARAPQVDRLAKNPRKVQFLFLENGKRVFTDGERTVELIDIGPNPHAREMVIAYLPKERIAFQGDLFFAPANDTPLGPPQAPTVSFARQIKERGLVIDRIASVHGRTATISEFNRATGEMVAGSN